MIIEYFDMLRPYFTDDGFCTLVLFQTDTKISKLKYNVLDLQWSRNFKERWRFYDAQLLPTQKDKEYGLTYSRFERLSGENLDKPVKNRKSIWSFFLGK